MNSKFTYVNETIKNKNFNWEFPPLETINKTTLNFAKKIYDGNLICEVYLNEDNLIIMEHKFNCYTDLKNINNALKNINNRKVDKFKIPLSFPVKTNTKCENYSEYNCDFVGCPLMIAGYIYHMIHNLKKDITVFYPQEEIKVEDEKFEEIIIDEELITKHKVIFDEIDNNIYLQDNIKFELKKIIKTLNNYNEFKNFINIKPNLNISISENTDTINNLCKGQEKFIEQYIKILKYFNFIKDNNNIKYINFKQIKKEDYFTDENYKEEIIVLENIYILNDKFLKEINNEIQLNISMVKEKFPSYILNNSNNKIFIICDKEVNIKNFYNTYSSLKSLFSNMHIKDFTLDEIYDIFYKKIKNESGKIKHDDMFFQNFKQYIENNYLYSPYKNLEFIDFIYNEAISHSFKTDNPMLITKNDLYVFKDKKNEESKTLDKLIGLENVKAEIKNLEIFLAFKNKKELNGDKMPKIDLHMCFLGNPGTGKTTVARLMAGILFNMGYIRYNKCLECEAKDLIANVAGETSIKTSEKLQEALGGVLFIDEAYALGESEYGKECIATLIKGMEDFRNDLIVILAGYNTEMMQFLEINTGFKSRIAYYFDFVDYKNEELLQMAISLLNEYNFKLENANVEERIIRICEYARKSSHFGNGRFVRNLVDSVLRQHAINNIFNDNKEKSNYIISEKDIIYKI